MSSQSEASEHGDAAEPTRMVLSDVSGVLRSVSAQEIACLAEAVQAADAVFVTGQGRSGLMGQAFAMRLMQLGLRAHVVGDATCPAIGERDLLVAISGSGTTPRTAHVAQTADSHRARVFAVTSDPDSPLAAIANDIVTVPRPTERSRQPGMTFFEQATLLVLDAVVLELMARTGVTEAAMLARHANLE